jgi:hypothetical protein
MMRGFAYNEEEKDVEEEMPRDSHVIIGYGEVGEALHKIFPSAEVDDIPKNKLAAKQQYSVMHICFPYVDKHFVTYVRAYQNKFKPHITIIHSSVPIGTSDSLAAVHSPVRGVHPNIEEGIRTFVKFFGGMKAMEAARIFERKGIKTQVIRDSRTTEALKLWDTTQYGVMILLEKEIHKFCRINGLDFEVIYGIANATYNDGYARLGMQHVIRPALMHKDGKIGGHCVVENAHLLNTPSAKRIIKENSQL